MRNRQAQGLKGPVWKVVEEYASFRRAWVFDRRGEPVEFRSQNQKSGRPEYVHDFDRAPKQIRVIRNDDGSRTELQNLLGRPGTWVPRGLRGFCAFPTAGPITEHAKVGATTAETHYSAQGALVRTVFRGAANEELSVVVYTCDGAGRVLEAVQYNGADAPATEVLRSMLPPAMDPTQQDEAVRSILSPTADASREAAVLRSLLSPGSETSRVRFEYDSAGRVKERTLYAIAIGKQQRTSYEYNEHGDVVMERQDEQEPTRFEYEYDAWGNWTQKLVRDSHGGSERYTRLITYYTDL